MPSIPANTKLLLHCDGADTSTTFTDSSTSAHTVTAVADAQVDTSDKVFGTGSLLLDGTGDYLSVPDSDDWYFNGDFTIGMRLKFLTVRTTGIIAQDQSNTAGFDVYYASGAINFLVDDGGPAVSWAWTPTVNTWYDFEIDRSGNSWYLFINGTQTGGTQTSAAAMSNRTSVLRIGCTWYDGAVNIPMHGHMDEILVIRGSANHTSSYTSPTNPYGTADTAVKDLIANTDMMAFPR